MVMFGDLDCMRTILILKVDLELLHLSKVTRGPLDFLQVNNFIGAHPVSHDNYIFFPNSRQLMTTMLSSSMATYDWLNDE